MNTQRPWFKSLAQLLFALMPIKCRAVDGSAGNTRIDAANGSGFSYNQLTEYNIGSSGLMRNKLQALYF
ncbi:hypothetical protein AXE65_04725 [Ventosimonas gracilis]|uniref:Uncharacterized protein n=1 Tax=Ventosimonas gracilis TaxID=1680762 RepID=A0A139SQI1_9GAMM|nr:hypothetical protein [Ventosimonas gracilis]KXU36797.1 hypothetical protein AXE65_04725 [Ventosimonas gracilis]